MWNVLCQSVRGTSHERDGAACQDYSTAVEVPLPAGPVLVLACADGAGSAAHSQLGAQLACDALVSRLAVDLVATGGLTQVSRERAIGWARASHEAVLAGAAIRGVEPRQFACTLLFGVLGPAGAAFGQLGDGAIVVRRDGRHQHVFWPQSGEYVNTTNFICDSRFESLLEFVWFDEPVDEVALLTDGLQSLALDFAKRAAHAPFFAPMFDVLRGHEAPETLLVPLGEFLASPAVCQRTDDDKTLILATRAAK